MPPDQALFRGMLIIPNYNQGPELVSLLPKVLAHYPASDIVFVDDGSTDNSVQTAQSHGLCVIRHERNRGIGAAIRTGIGHARSLGYDFVCIFSSNGKMLPDQIGRVVGPVARGQADYVTGSRFMAGGQSPALPRGRGLAIRVYSLTSGFILGRAFSDITCGFRAYRLDFLFNCADIEQRWLDRYELEYYVHYCFCKARARIVEVPVTIVYSHLSPRRRSKIVPIIDWWRILRAFFYSSCGSSADPPMN